MYTAILIFIRNRFQAKTNYINGISRQVSGDSYHLLALRRVGIAFKFLVKVSSTPNINVQAYQIR